MPVNHLEPIDLVCRIRLAQNALVGGLDPTHRHLPYYNCGFRAGDLTRLSPHVDCDLHHHVARAILALDMVEEITGQPIEKAVFDNLIGHLFSLFDNTDDMPGMPSRPSQERFVSLHDMREVTLALTALIRRGEKRAEDCIRRMVRRLRQALDENGRLQFDRLPDYVRRNGSQLFQLGRLPGALLKYYYCTEDEVALETSLLLTNFMLENCFTEQGAVKEEAGHHSHSINGAVTGMLELSLAVDNQKMFQQAKAAFDVGLRHLNSSFGWSRERVDVINNKGEGNATADYLRGALLLGKVGYSDYFGLAERILRGHLLPSQIVDIEGFSDEPDAEEDYRRNLASRILGGFGFRTPNDFIVPGYINPYMGYKTIPLAQSGTLVRSTKNAVLIKQADMLPADNYDLVITVYDVHSAVAEGLCAAWHSTVTEDTLGIRINMLFSRDFQEVSVKSYLSDKGKVEIQNDGKRNVFVRIPRWVLPEELNLKINESSRSPVFVGPYVMIPGEQGPQTAIIEFPVHKERTYESISFTEYTIDWRGDQIVAMSPLATVLPMFPPCA